MFNNGKEKLLVLAVLAMIAKANISFAADAGMATVDAADLPINVANSSADKKEATTKDNQVPLVSPTKAQTGNVALPVSQMQKDENKPAGEVASQVKPAEIPAVSATAENPDIVSTPAENDFSFDLKMKSINAPAPQVVAPQNESAGEPANTNQASAPKEAITDADLPKEIEYKVDTMENLGNSILSQMDGDLFSQMSEIEKSTTLLTLELRREKLRNEIEAQKAIRQKNIDDQKRKHAEDKLRYIEKEKHIESNFLKEKKILLDKEKVF